MPETNRTVKSRAIHFFPVISVAIFWLGACVVSSLLVDPPHITQLGWVTLPFVAACVAAFFRISAGLRKAGVDGKGDSGRG